jgi:formylglycine-generating enzyme required for sulfatase activity
MRIILLTGFALFCLSQAYAAEAAGLTNSLGMALVKISAGDFVMGSPKEYAEATARKVTSNWYRDSAPSEWPQRRVRISRPFYMGAHEVTLGQFRAFVQATSYRTDAERDGKGAAGKRAGKWVESEAEFNWRNMGYDRNDEEPVVNVSWNDARAFCDWLSKKEKTTYRLPTEAEWEYACRAGTTTAFFWGDDETLRSQFAWTSANSGGGPRKIGELKPNPWGLYDMLGNAYEYCADGWSTNVAAALRAPSGNVFVDPFVPSGNAGNLIVVRSTSWGTNPLHCRSAFRGSAPKDHRNQRDGFRVVRALQNAD